MTIEPPSYFEGHPRLVSVDLRTAQMADDPSVCRFHTKAGEHCGWLFPVPAGDEKILLQWQMDLPWLYPKSDYQIIVFRDRSGKPGRPAPFDCPSCGRRVETLVLRGSWACRECHKLSHRSTLLQSSVRHAERSLARLTDLANRLRGGRPKGMRHETFKRLKHEISRLEKAEPHLRTTVANRECQTQIDSEWMSCDEALRNCGFDAEANFPE